MAIGRPGSRTDVSHGTAAAVGVINAGRIRASVVLADIRDAASDWRRIELDARTRRHVDRGASRDIERDKPRVVARHGRGDTGRERLLRGHAVADDATAISGPLRASTKALPIGEPLQSGTVRMRDIKLDELKSLPSAVSERHRASAIGRKRDPPSIGRPGRPEVAAGSGRQRLRPTRRQIHRPEISRSIGSRRDENQLLAVG